MRIGDRPPSPEIPEEPVSADEPAAPAPVAGAGAPRDARLIQSGHIVVSPPLEVDPWRPMHRVALDDPLLARFGRRTRDDLLAIPGMDGPRADAVLAAVAAGKIDHWGDVERTLKEAGAADPPGIMKGIYRQEALDHVKAQGLGPGSSVLFLASEPTNAMRLDLEGEGGQVAAAVPHMTVVKDPTLGEIEALAATGAFKAVWASGHGGEGKLVFADDAGRAVAADAEAFARAVSASPEVQFVMASACHGGDGGEKSLLRAIAAHGPSAAGYEDSVRDDDAAHMSDLVAKAVARGVSFRVAVGAAYFEVMGRHGEEDDEDRGGMKPKGRDFDAPPPPPWTDGLWRNYVDFEKGANDRSGAAKPPPP